MLSSHTKPESEKVKSDIFSLGPATERKTKFPDLMPSMNNYKKTLKAGQRSLLFYNFMPSLKLAYFSARKKRDDRENDVLTKEQFIYFELYYKNKDIAWKALPQKGNSQDSA